MAAEQVLKALGPQTEQKLMSPQFRDKMPLPLAMDLLEMWQLSNPRKFREMGQNGSILTLLESQAPMLEAVADMQAEQATSQFLMPHEMMQMCGVPLTLREALGQ